MNRFVKSRRGFTLIEIMVVIVILALLAALIGPKIIGRSDDAKLTDAKLQIRNFETALKLYKLDNGVYPSTEQGLMSLLEKPTSGMVPRNWRTGGYMEGRVLPKDPWGTDYIYISPGEHGDYDLCSFGVDGVKGGEGAGADICSWDMQ